MSLYLTIGGAALASLLSLLFAILLNSVREFSPTRLADYLGKHDADRWFDTVQDHTAELAFLSAVARQLCNIIMWLAVFASFEQTRLSAWVRYGLTVVVAGAIAIFFSVALPHAAAKYASSEIVGFFAPLLHVLRLAFSPVTRLMDATDSLVRRALDAGDDNPEGEIEQEILSAVEEGEKEGVVDEQEREIIESAIEFGETTAAQIMTARQEMISLAIDSDLAEIKRIVEASAHSRIPVYERDLDHIVGILYAKDLIKHVGTSLQCLDLRSVMRPVMFTPETKPVSDLLRDFRAQKVHIAIVLDEYGGTAGLVTIEDILEELVGEISDEHEVEPAMLKRLDEHTLEADARIEIDELNRMLGLGLPEDAGYGTLGGFLIDALARIPEKGAVLERGGTRFTVTDAEPQRVTRVKIDLGPVEQSAEGRAISQ